MSYPPSVTRVPISYAITSPKDLVLDVIDQLLTSPSHGFVFVDDVNEVLTTLVAAAVLRLAAAGRRTIRRLSSVYTSAYPVPGNARTLRRTRNRVESLEPAETAVGQLEDLAEILLRFVGGIRLSARKFGGRGKLAAPSVDNGNLWALLSKLADGNDVNLFSLGFSDRARVEIVLFEAAFEMAASLSAERWASFGSDPVQKLLNRGRATVLQHHFETALMLITHEWQLGAFCGVRALLYATVPLSEGSGSEPDLKPVQRSFADYLKLRVAGQQSVSRFVEESVVRKSLAARVIQHTRADEVVLSRPADANIEASKPSPESAQQAVDNVFGSPMVGQAFATFDAHYANTLPVGTKVRWKTWNRGEYVTRSNTGWVLSKEPLSYPGEVAEPTEPGWTLYPEKWETVVGTYLSDTSKAPAPAPKTVPTPEKPHSEAPSGQSAPFWSSVQMATAAEIWREAFVEIQDVIQRHRLAELTGHTPAGLLDLIRSVLQAPVTKPVNPEIAVGDDVMVDIQSSTEDLSFIRDRVFTVKDLDSTFATVREKAPPGEPVFIMVVARKWLRKLPPASEVLQALNEAVTGKGVSK